MKKHVAIALILALHLAVRAEELAVQAIEHPGRIRFYEIPDAMGDHIECASPIDWSLLSHVAAAVTSPSNMV